MSVDNKIQETVQAQEGLLRWLLHAWREKNWLRLLLIADAILLIFLNPKTLNWALAIIQLEPPRFYAIGWFIGFAVIFIAAAIVALRSKTVPKPVSIDERRTIKGLRPFYFDDADIFDRLQRTEIIRECVSAITDKQFRFGVLSGLSGSGKTSFLQAGLWPTLSRNRHRCVYVKFTETEPLETLRGALIDASLLPPEITQESTLVSLLDSCDLSQSVSLVLLFDQFEQFFLQNKRAKDRKRFITGLADWYQTRPNQAVKILISIRSDFSDRLIELQKTMRYSLGPQDTFRLDKFDPKQAAAVLRVIAQTEGITIDETFVEELANQQLANPEDGLISPVDIQILALMIAGESAAEDRAFNRPAYDALGGIEGLLEKFLKRALGARETSIRHQAAFNVLLALTDFDSDSSAGTLTLEQLSQKLEKSFTRVDIEEATSWLAGGGVRLITPNQQAGLVVYELAHERLIPALRRLADKEFSEVDVARRLFERKVREWTANGEKTRYLLRGRDLRLSKRNRAQLVRNPQKDIKAKFLMRSLMLFRFKFGAMCMSLLLGVAAVSWWFSPSGQIWQAERDLATLTGSINDSDTLYRVSKNLLDAGKTENVHALLSKLGLIHRIEILARLRRHYEDIGAKHEAEEIKLQEDAQNSVLSKNIQERIAVSVAYSKIGDTNTASRLMYEAQVEYERMEPAFLSTRFIDSSPAHSYRSIRYSFAKGYLEIRDLNRAAEQLALILNSSYWIMESNSTVVLDAALFCEKLGPVNCNNTMWEKILHAAERLSPPDNIFIQSVVARALAAHGEYKTAEALLERVQTKTRRVTGDRLSRLRFQWDEMRYITLWEVFEAELPKDIERRFLPYFQVIPPAELDSKSRIQIFRAVTEAYLKIAVGKKDENFLWLAIEAARWLDQKESADIQVAFALTYLAFGKENRALDMLGNACIAADETDEPERRAEVMDLIQAAFEKLPETTRKTFSSETSDDFSSYSDVCLLSLQSQLWWHNGRTEEARNTLAKAEELAARRSIGANSLTVLANTCALMGNTEKAVMYLDQIMDIAVGLAPEAKAQTMSALCYSYAKNNQWRRARQMADQTGNDVFKAVSLSNILAVWGQHNQTRPK